MGSRLFLRAYILEGEQGGVGRGGDGIIIPEDMVVIGLLVVAMEVVLGKAFLQGDMSDRNSTGKGRQEKLALGPGTCT